MTKSTTPLKISKVDWSTIRERVKQVNPELTSVLDTIKCELPLYVANYAFGATIDENGEFYLPHDDGSTVQITDPSIPADLYTDLNYTSSIPVGLVLSNSLELYLQRDEQRLPWALMKPGYIFALWRMLDGEISKSYHSHYAWHMRAGMRHGFILPKISAAPAYQKLVRSRSLKAKSPPRDIYDHFAIFRNQSQHPDFSQTWQMDLLFFSKAWFESLSKMPELDLFFHKKILISSRFWRNKMIFDFMWNGFIDAVKKENLSVKSHIFDITKNILLVAISAVPGFAPAMDNTSAPIQGIQQDFLDIYGLKAAPVIMIPTHFDMYDPEAKPVYWSLQFPCYLESVPNPKTRTSHLDDLNEIALLMEYLFDNVASKKLAVIINTPIEYCLQHVKFDYFHSDAPPHDPLIRHSREMPLEDKRLVQCIVPGREHETFEFSEVSPFVRGCVRFSLRKAKL